MEPAAARRLRQRGEEHRGSEKRTEEPGEAPAGDEGEPDDDGCRGPERGELGGDRERANKARDAGPARVHRAGRDEAIAPDLEQRGERVPADPECRYRPGCRREHRRHETERDRPRRTAPSHEDEHEDVERARTGVDRELGRDEQLAGDGIRGRLQHERQRHVARPAEETVGVDGRIDDTVLQREAQPIHTPEAALTPYRSSTCTIASSATAPRTNPATTTRTAATTRSIQRRRSSRLDAPAQANVYPSPRAYPRRMRRATTIRCTSSGRRRSGRRARASPSARAASRRSGHARRAPGSRGRSPRSARRRRRT